MGELANEEAISSDFWELLLSLRIADVVDLVLVTSLMFVGIVWLRDSRARFAFGGVVALAVLYFGARQFGLTLTSWVLQGFAAVSVLVLIVVFDDDLRRLFERFALTLLRKPSRTAKSKVSETLTRTLSRLARDRHGALVVLPGREPLERHLEGGVPLQGKVSEVLLLSLFDPHSPGHDGAVLLRTDRVERFAVHLPLSADHEQLGQRGTRHAAALGLAERTDALCLVVSEERGEVSVAQRGRLTTLTRPESVGEEIERFVAGVGSKQESTEPSHTRRALRRWREGLVAVVLTASLWLLAVPGAEGADMRRSVPVRVYDLPDGFAVKSVKPKRVTVTLHGKRRDLLWLDESEIEARIYAYLVMQGRRSFTVDPGQVSHPSTVTVVSVHPPTVRIQVERLPKPPEPEP